MPENLKPKLPGSDDGAPVIAASRASGKSAATVSPPGTYFSGNPQTLGGAAAVSIQVDEGRIPQAATQNAAPESAKLASELSEEDREAVSDLKARDREVRAHEAAHAATGQGYAGSPQFEYVRGPDGIQYAVGGHVSIDTSAVPDDPEATIEKMHIVKAAALAPARPSGQDRSVAAAAEAAIRQAEGDLNAKRREETTEETAGESGESQSPALAAVTGAPAVSPSGAPGAENAGLVPANPDAVSLRQPLVAGSGLNLIA